jgi:hypothetical protein
MIKYVFFSIVSIIQVATEINIISVDKVWIIVWSKCGINVEYRKICSDL